MLFTSDNWVGVHPKIMDAIVAANGAPVPAYGADDISQQAKECLSSVFGVSVDPVFVATGSAANSLALACITPPWGVVFCHENGHIHLDEAAAPEFYTGGAKIVPISGDHGKITPDGLASAMEFYLPAQTHHAVPAVLSLTQGTEAGTVYRPDEISALVNAAKSFGLKVHMDGARFANACAFLGVDPKAITTDAGIDVLTLGGTKNGCMVAEAILFFDPGLASSLPHRVKRAGQSFSKGRFMAAQWLAYFEDGLWLDLAGTANRAAAKLADGIEGHPACNVIHPPEINEVFVTMPDEVAENLKTAGAAFYDWVQPRNPYGRTQRRLVTSFATTDDDVDEFLKALSRCA